jgi:hypothetical protein
VLLTLRTCNRDEVELMVGTIIFHKEMLVFGIV